MKMKLEKSLNHLHQRYDTSFQFEDLEEVETNSKLNISSPKGRNPCKFFQNGQCVKGNKCPFEHNIPKCKFYLNGFCRNGNNCPFNHIKDNEGDFEEETPNSLDNAEPIPIPNFESTDIFETSSPISQPTIDLETLLSPDIWSPIDKDLDEHTSDSWSGFFKIGKVNVNKNELYSTSPPINTSSPISIPRESTNIFSLSPSTESTEKSRIESFFMISNSFSNQSSLDTVKGIIENDQNQEPLPIPEKIDLLNYSTDEDLNIPDNEIISSSPTSDLKNSEEETSSKKSPTKKSKQQICSFHLEGFCKFGSTCRNIHGDFCNICEKPALIFGNYKQNLEHLEECQNKQEFSNAIEQSKNFSCFKCKEYIVERGKRFGIMVNCEHCFCLPCIKDYRTTSQNSECPVCHVFSPFVIPSYYMVTDQKEKDELIDQYKSKMKQIPCKYFDFGKGICKFAEHCLYSHQNLVNNNEKQIENERIITDSEGVAVQKTINLGMFITINNIKTKTNKQ